mmetsp:Transcript_8933/g.29581  ORF Transcript_8933/g.29581 Transcript_8933/m.29581 type:complete len:267 (+) Transcript_8933:244-1044(+)|eukprot:scaffold8048_cov103-Isochrysis_galbana.AAC.4
MSMGRGAAMAAVTAERVISPNVTRSTSSPAGSARRCSSSCQTCHAMASPSRSGSIASSTRLARRVAAQMACITRPAPGASSNDMSKPASGRTDPGLDGSARTWPLHASSSYRSPTNLRMVEILAGDSTISTVGPSAAGGVGLRPARVCAALLLGPPLLARSRSTSSNLTPPTGRPRRASSSLSSLTLSEPGSGASELAGMASMRAVQPCLTPTKDGSHRLTGISAATAPAVPRPAEAALACRLQPALFARPRREAPRPKPAPPISM